LTQADEMVRYRVYILMLTGVSCLSFGTVYFIFWVYLNLPCNYHGYGNGWFLAMCNEAHFGDYEEGAFWYALDSNAVANLRKADIVFFGDSRTQMAFSTTATRSYFAQRSLSYFLFGFAYTQQDAFALATLMRYGIRPHILVINTDPFFNGHTGTSEAVMQGNILTRTRYMMKFLFQKIHSPICRSLPSLCNPLKTSVFRSPIDGSWRVFGPNDNQPIITKKKEPIPLQDVSGFVKRAHQFFEFLHADRRCIVLTGIPNSERNSEEIAERLAAALGVTAISPDIDGLLTTDGDHLNMPSAERWSAAFLLGFDAVLQRCVQSSKPFVE
jgi:hypothetical protein